MAALCGGRCAEGAVHPPSDEHLRSHEAAWLPDPGPVKQRMGKSTLYSVK